MKSRFNKSIKILLIAFVLTIPLTNRDLFSFGVDFLIPVRVVFLGICALIGIYLLNIFRTKGLKDSLRWVRDQAKDRLFVFLVMLWFVRVVSIINSKNISASLNLLSFYTSMIIIYLVLKYLFNKDIHFGFKLFKLYLISVVFSVFYALTQVLANLFLGIKLPGLLVGGNYYRVPGPFYDANHLPAFLLTGIPMFVSFGWFFDRPWKKYLVFFFALVSSMVLFLTFSRSGFIGFGVVIISSIAFIVFYRYWIKLLIPLTLISVVVLIVFLSDKTSHSLLDRLGSIFDSAERSTQAHTLLLRGEIDLYMRNPLIGVGYGSFSEHFRESYHGKQHLKIDPTADIRLPAHSIWLEVLTETGTLGIILYGLVMFTLVRELFMAIRTALNKEWRMYFIALFSSTVALLVSGIFYSYNLEFFWFFLFSSYLLARNYRKLVPEVSLDLNQPERVRWSEIFIPVVVAIVAGFVMFTKLGDTTLVEFDEAIYATIAKNMARTGDYLVPTFRDGLPWFEKPPLYLWLTAPFVKMFGVYSFPIRFWSALFGVGTILLVYLIGRVWFSRLVGVIASIALLSSFHFVRYSRMGMMDVTLTFFMTSSVFLFYLAKKLPLLFLLSGVSLGLAFMTKGFVSLLVIPVLLVMLLIYFRDFQRKYLALFVLGFALTVVPWHWYMYQRFGQEFLDSYFGYHILLRFASDVESKTLPFWTYVTVIINSIRLWVPVLVVACIWIIYRLVRVSKDWKKLIVLISWTLAIFLPLSLAKSKLIWYVVPIYPVLALISAYALGDLVRVITQKFKIKTSLAASVVLIVIGLTSLGYLYQRWDLIGENDYNRDAYTLIKKKAAVEPTGRYFLITLGIGEGFTSYYSDGNVDVAPENMMEGLLDEEKRRFFIVKTSMIKEFLARRGPEFPASIIATSGELALVVRHGELLK